MIRNLLFPRIYLFSILLLGSSFLSWFSHAAEYQGPHQLSGWLPYSSEPLAANQRIVVFQNQFFVFGMKFYRSFDGISWTETPHPYPDSYPSWVWVFGDKLYVRCSNRYFFSTDLETWQPISLEDFEVIRDKNASIERVNNRSYRIEDGKAYYLSSGGRWTPVVIRGLENERIREIFNYAGQYCLAISVASEEDPAQKATGLVISDDGIEWDSSEVIRLPLSLGHYARDFQSIGNSILFGSTSLRYLIKDLNLDSLRQLTTYLDLVDLAVIGEKAIGITSDAVVTIDFEAETWDIHDLGTTHSVNDVVYWNGEYYSVSVSGSSKIIHSTDGVDWEIEYPLHGVLFGENEERDLNSSYQLNGIKELEILNGKLCAFRYRNTNIAVKDDEGWITYPIVYEDGAPHIMPVRPLEVSTPVFSNGSYYLINRYAAKIYQTEDLSLPWRVSWDSGGSEIQGDLIRAPGQILARLAVGRRGPQSDYLALLKNTGTGWLSLEYPSHHVDLEIFNGIYVGIRPNGINTQSWIYSSRDGVEWQRKDLPDFQRTVASTMTPTRKLFVLSTDRYFKMNLKILYSRDGFSWTTLDLPEGSDDECFSNASALGTQIWFSGGDHIWILTDEDEWHRFPSYAFTSDSGEIYHYNQTVDFSVSEKGLRAHNGTWFVHKDSLQGSYVVLDASDGWVDESYLESDSNHSLTIEVHRVGDLSESFGVPLAFSGSASFGVDYVVEGLSEGNVAFFSTGTDRIDLVLRPVMDKVEEGSSSARYESIVVEALEGAGYHLTPSFSRIDFRLYD